MKIIIVGAGISGLATYLALVKHLPSDSLPPEILIYEAYNVAETEESLSNERGDRNGNSKPARFLSAGLGVGPNGMAVLRALDPSLHDDVLAQGYPSLRFKLQGANELLLSSMKSVNDPRTDDAPYEPTIMSSRYGVWKCLLARVPINKIISGVPVSRANRAQGGRPSITLADGTTIEADLVIGADGVRSVVKKAILGDGLTDDYPPHNEQILSVGGFMPTSYITSASSFSRSPNTSGQTVLTIGAEGFFGYAPCTTATDAKFTRANAETDTPLPYGPTAMWWSSFECETYPTRMRDFDATVAKQKLIQRHADCTDPVIANIIKDIDIPIMVATWTTPTLPTWEADGLLILGDAAHALPSSSGQGASQCLEDAYAFALLLAHQIKRLQNPAGANNNKTTTSDPPATTLTDPAPEQTHSAVIKAARMLMAMRMPHVKKILVHAQRMGEKKKRMGPVALWMTYGIIWMFSALGVMESFSKAIYNYDVEEEVEKVIAAEERI